MSALKLTFKYIKDMVEIRNEIIASNPSIPPPSWVRITTITMCSKFLDIIDLPKFREAFKEIGSLIIRNKDTHFEGFKWTLKDTKFYNQVTIGYKDSYSNKSIKIFPNGSIQVAGCADLFDCQRILNQLSLIMKIVLNRKELVPVDEPSVKMINTNFSLNSSVNILKIITKLSHPPFRVTYDPDRYSAVKIKFVPGPNMKQVTASIFSTGKIIVTGAQTLDEIAQSYRILNHNLNDPKIFVKTVTKFESFENILGATYEQWNSVI
jgi:TATA-box binding protein (TBP) (component of TFIID and TFIIIB)